MCNITDLCLKLKCGLRNKVGIRTFINLRGYKFNDVFACFFFFFTCIKKLGSSKIYFNLFIVQI